MMDDAKRRDETNVNRYEIETQKLTSSKQTLTRRQVATDVCMDFKMRSVMKLKRKNICHADWLKLFCCTWLLEKYTHDMAKWWSWLWLLSMLVINRLVAHT